MPARTTAHACKAASEDAAVDEAVELALHQRGHPMAATGDGDGKGRAVMADRAVQRGVLDVTRR